MKVGFIGTGDMGFGMAVNMAKGQKNFTYQVFARRPEVLSQLQAKGIATTNTLSEVGDSDYLFLCLPNAEVVTQILTTLLPGLKAGQTIIDCSTINYFAAQELWQKLAEQGIDFLDCPVSGMHARAMNGTLTIMCGGKEESFKKIKPLLAYMGATILYMGQCGAGQLTKAINNCIYNICFASFCELMPLGVKLGLDAENLGKVITSGTGSSYAAQNFIPKILADDFYAGFSLRKAYKDMLSIADISNKNHIPLPTFNGTLETYQLALQKVDGNLYKHAMIKVYEEILGVQCRAKKKEVEK